MALRQLLPPGTPAALARAGFPTIMVCIMTHPIPEAQLHGELKEIFPGVHFVSGSMKMGPFKFSRNMVVLVQGERLVIVNSMRLNDDGLAALDKLGKVTDVIRLAGFHGSDDRFYKDRYDAKVWAIKGQTYFTGANPAKGTVYFTPDAELDSDSELPVADASLYIFDTSPSEGILRIEAGGGTLITGDSMQNWATADRFFSWFGGTVMKVMGFLRPHGLGPGWLKACKPSTDQVAGILELDFDNVLPGHGAAVLGGALEAYRPAVGEYVAKWGEK